MSKAVWRTEKRPALELKLPGVHRWGRRPYGSLTSRAHPCPRDPTPRWGPLGGPAHALARAQRGCSLPTQHHTGV